MNNSQLLYKISNLQYTIRMKEVEYANVVKAGDQHNADLNKAALNLLKDDLAATIKEFNSVPPQQPAAKPKSPKKIKWWQSFLPRNAS